MPSLTLFMVVGALLTLGQCTTKNVRMIVGVQSHLFASPYKNTIQHMARDLAPDSDGLLFTDSLAIYSIGADFAEPTMIVGQTNGPPSEIKYKGKTDGTAPKAADLYPITGFAQVNSTTILFVASTKSCIVRINRDTSIMSLVAGTCGSTGMADGLPGVAKFNKPRVIIRDVNDANSFIVSDKSNNAVRKLRLDTGEVTTIMASGLDNPIGIFWNHEGTAIFVSNKNYVSKLTIQGEKVENTYVAGYTKGAPEDSLNATIIVFGAGIVEILPDILFLADPAKQRLQTIDIGNEVSKPACHGFLDEAKCKLVFPYSLLYLDGMLYMGDSDGVSRAPVLLTPTQCKDAY